MFKWMRNRSKPREILVETLIEFVRRSLLPSISSVVTKSLLYVGASLMAWPLIESIFLSGILKNSLELTWGSHHQALDLI
ncbi:hypothetical protein [Pseudomonas sp. REB1044]|uniref:hypothetical protein n=1 Tax=Pseudomonas sp. REB1044 TaxID=2675224 RepID=UPI00315CC9AE